MSFLERPRNAFRYRYINKVYLRSGARHGVYCDPVKRNGKCVVGRGNQLVKFPDGTLSVVVRRALRLADKYDKENKE